MIKAILMDFNGVVIDDEPIQHEAYRAIFGEEGIEISDEDYYARLGMDDRTFVASIYEAAGKTVDNEKVRETARAKTARWREIVDKEVPLFPGIENFVKKISTELALGIVSMSRREEIDFVLERTGLIPYFSTIVSADDIDACKPDPACYREGFRQIDLARIAAGGLPMVHADCVVIEDSPPGVQAGKAADLYVLGVTNTVGEAELRAAGADAVAKNLDDWMPESFRRVFD